MGQTTLGKTEIARTSFRDWEWKQKYVWQLAKSTCAWVELEESQKSGSFALNTNIITDLSSKLCKIKPYHGSKDITQVQKCHDFAHFPLKKLESRTYSFECPWVLKTKPNSFSLGLYLRCFLPHLLSCKNMHLPQLWQVQLGQLVNAEHFSWSPVFSSHFWLSTLKLNWVILFIAWVLSMFKNGL